MKDGIGLFAHHASGASVCRRCEGCISSRQVADRRQGMSVVLSRVCEEIKEKEDKPAVRSRRAEKWKK